MLCSSCSQNVKPVIAFDIDGTLGNYYEHFTRFAETYWNRSLNRGWDGIGDWEEFLGLTREEYRQAKLAYRQGGMKRSLPVYEDAKWLMNEVARDSVYDIWVATTRPWQSLDSIDRDTQWWLQINRWHVSGLLYGEDKYDQLVSRVDRERVIGVFDDLAVYANYAKNLELPVWQPTRTHNSRDKMNGPVQGNLVDAAKWLFENHTQWEEERNGR